MWLTRACVEWDEAYRVDSSLHLTITDFMILYSLQCAGKYSNIMSPFTPPPTQPSPLKTLLSLLILYKPYRFCYFLKNATIIIAARYENVHIKINYKINWKSSHYYNEMFYKNILLPDVLFCHWIYISTSLLTINIRTIVF